MTSFTGGLDDSGQFECEGRIVGPIRCQASFRDGEFLFPSLACCGASALATVGASGGVKVWGVLGIRRAWIRVGASGGVKVRGVLGIMRASGLGRCFRQQAERHGRCGALEARPREPHSLRAHPKGI